MGRWNPHSKCTEILIQGLEVVIGYVGPCERIIMRFISNFSLRAGQPGKQNPINRIVSSLFRLVAIYSPCLQELLSCISQSGYVTVGLGKPGHNKAGAMPKEQLNADGLGRPL